MKHTKVKKTPISKGHYDPCYIPYQCQKCGHYVCPACSPSYCDFREDRKFKPDVFNSCFVNKTIYKYHKEETDEKSCERSTGTTGDCQLHEEGSAE